MSINNTSVARAVLEHAQEVLAEINAGHPKPARAIRVQIALRGRHFWDLFNVKPMHGGAMGRAFQLRGIQREGIEIVGEDPFGFQACTCLDFQEAGQCDHLDGLRAAGLLDSPKSRQAPAEMIGPRWCQ